MELYNESLYEKPTISFTDVAWKKINKLVAECKIEIAWHGLVTKEDDNLYIIHDILVYPQEANGVHVESCEEKYPLWLMDLEDDIIEQLRMQGHSHVNMSPTPSSDDDKNRQEIMTQVKDFYIFMIINKSKRLWIQLYDVEQNIIYNKKDLIINIPKTWEQIMIEEYVTEREYSRNFQKKKKKKFSFDKKDNELKPSRTNPYPYIRDGQTSFEEYIESIKDEEA